MRVLYIASEPGLAVNAVAIASGVRSLFPGAENILVDPRAFLWPEYVAPALADLWARSGFRAEVPQRQEFQDVLRHDYPARGYLFYRRIFQRLKPSVVVVMHEYGYAYYAVQAARLSGIPSYHVQHAVYDPERFDPAPHPEAAGLPSLAGKARAQAVGLGRRMVQRVRGRECPEELAPWRGSLQLPAGERYPLHADRVALWSAHYKRMLLRQRPDFGAERIDVVGFPHGDKMLSDSRVPRAASLPGPGKLAVCLYCPFHEIDGNDVLVHPEEALLEAVSALRMLDPLLKVVVIPHPNYNPAEQVRRLKLLLSGFAEAEVRDDSADFASLCDAASLVFGVISSLFYIAMLKGVPVLVQAYVLATLHDYQAIEGGGAIPVFSRSALPRQLDRALNDAPFLARLRENQKALCAELLGEFDGKSGLRAASALGELIRRERKTISEGGTR